MNRGLEANIERILSNKLTDKSQPSTADKSSYAAKAASIIQAVTAAKSGIDDSWHWDARKCLRFFPIPGKDDKEIRISLDDFFATKLKVPTGDLKNEDDNYIWRIRTPRKSKIQHEVIVAFTSVAARDLAQSHARNLSEFTGSGGTTFAGVRMEIPERLLSDFKALERYGHAMKEKHGSEFKRHTKMDDSAKCVYLDLFLPKQKMWVRVDVPHARVDNEKRTKKTTRKADPDMLSTVEPEVDNSG